MSKPNGHELWAIILEKVWAKVHGTYRRTKSGRAYEAFRDLTGAPAYGYVVKDEPDIIKKMVKAKD